MSDTCYNTPLFHEKFSDESKVLAVVVGPILKCIGIFILLSVYCANNCMD